MTDWTSIAKAAGLDIPAKDLTRVAQALNSLDEVFRPLAKSLTPEMEPAASFRADQERA
jgi:hypothetical protein